MGFTVPFPLLHMGRRLPSLRFRINVLCPLCTEFHLV